MRRALVATALLAACYAPTPPSGAPCDPEAPRCPSGQVCAESGGTYACLNPDEVPAPVDAALEDAADASPPDGVSDAPPNLDRDEDGVPNNEDNCADAANPLQENEDGDTYGDACDPCPPYAEADPIDDPDGDGVSGRCDPNPTVAGDRIVYFTGFTAPTKPDELAATGTWTYSGGRAVGSVPETQVATLTLPGPASSETVMTQAIVTNITVGNLSPTSQFSVGAVTQRTGQDNGTGCFLAASTFTPERQAMFNTATSAVLASEPYPWEEDELYHVAIRRTGTTYRCFVARENGQDANDIEGTYTPTPNAPLVGVRVRSGTAEFAWLLVLDRS